jgi:hypothetical protein
MLQAVFSFVSVIISINLIITTKNDKYQKFENCAYLFSLVLTVSSIAVEVSDCGCFALLIRSTEACPVTEVRKLQVEDLYITSKSLTRNGNYTLFGSLESLFKTPLNIVIFQGKNDFGIS